MEDYVKAKDLLRKITSKRFDLSDADRIRFNVAKALTSFEFCDDFLKEAEAEYRYYTCEQVASILQVNVETVWRWIRDERLPAVRISKNMYRISCIELDNFLSRR